MPKKTFHATVLFLMISLQHASNQIKELRLKIVDYSARSTAFQSGGKNMSREARQQSFRDTQRMIQEAVQVAQRQIMQQGFIDWNCPEFAYLCVHGSIDAHHGENVDISASCPEPTEFAQVESQGAHDSLLIPEYEGPTVSGMQSSQQEPPGSTAHIILQHVHNHGQKDNIPDLSPLVPNAHEKVRSWLARSPHSLTNSESAGRPAAQATPINVPQAERFDPMGQGGFFYALAEGINKYLIDAGYMPRNVAKLTPEKLSGALGAYVAFHQAGNMRCTDYSDDRVTVNIIRHETLMGFSKKPVSGSLINILQQSAESAIIYGSRIAEGKVVYLTSHHVHNLAHMTGCQVFIRDERGQVVMQASSRSPHEDNPVITITITPAAREPDTHNASSIIWDGTIPIYNISDKHATAPYLFSAHVACIMTKR
jgi:hypothetical protein